MSPRERAGIVIVSAHLDDAVFSCWSLIDSPDDVAVVTVFTAGPDTGVVADWDRGTGVDSAARMKRREEDDAAALALAGRGAVNLGCRERHYGDGLVPREALAPHVLDAGTAVFAPAAVALRADFVHPDHVEVRDAVLSLRPDANLYADQPYCRFRPDFELRGELARGRIARPVALSPEQRARKAQAVGCHAGEVARLEQRFGAFARPEDLEYELFWLSAGGTMAGNPRASWAGAEGLV